MRRYKEGIHRGQSDLFPSRLDDYVDESNPVRAIDAYVETLDLERMGFGNTREDVRPGQPPYSPGALLKLYLYGYIHRIRSSRHLEQESKRNLEVIWLLSGLRPCYKTIADFRKDNAKALRKTHKEFILLCKELKLFGAERIAIDGSFFRGNVSKKSFITQKGLTKAIKALEADITAWLSGLDTQDQRETSGDSTDNTGLSEKLTRIKQLQENKQRQEDQLRQLQALGKTQYSHIDSDARLLNKGTQKLVGYNVQIATDDKHKLIVADDLLSEPNDLQSLAPMAKSAKATLEADTLDALADGGYYNTAHIVECLQDGITPYVPMPEHTGKSPNRGVKLRRQAFVYDEQCNVYRCPAGQEMKPAEEPRIIRGMRMWRYASSETHCGSCQWRGDCLSAKSKCREIWRNEHEALIEQHRQRMDANTKVMRLRAGLVEHPFGTLKQRAGWSHFLVRGKPKVLGEWSLMVMTYNFTRVLNILGMEKFIEICTQLHKEGHLMPA